MNEYFFRSANDNIRLMHGDCLELMKSLPDASVDSIVTDPPYELGFMGRSWDNTGIANSIKMWAEALRVLKPGGHLLTFSGSRTYHRMVCAIEDAGFEVRDQIMWLYGSGFPKSHNGPWGGTALKPAHEPICVARKPLIGTVAANVQQFGTGALNIDGCRVGNEVVSTHSRGANSAFPKRPGETSAEESGRKADQRAGLDHSERTGRWPANVIHDGSPEVLDAFAKFGERGASAPVKGTEASAASVGRVTGERGRVPGAFHADTGTAARFFYCAKASRKDRNEGVGGSDVPAVGTDATMREREDADWPARNGNHHPTVKPTELMAYLCRLVTPPGGVVFDPFMGSGSTGKAAVHEGFRFIGIDMTLEYVEIARARIQAVANDNQPQTELF